MVEGKIELDVEQLRKIAEYYQFPMAVFLMSPKNFPESEESTRLEQVMKKANAFNKIQAITDKFA